MSDLVERLREMYENWGLGSRGPVILGEAADRITTLEADLAKVREALEKIVSTNQIREFMGDDANDGYGNQGWVVRDGQYAVIARAALSQDKEARE